MVLEADAVRLFRWRTVRSWVSALGGSAAALATLYLGLVHENVWKATEAEKVAAFVVVAAVAILSALARPIRVFVTGRQEVQRRKVETTLRGLLFAVHKLTDREVDLEPLGASAWFVAGRWWWQRLHREARERFKDTPGPSEIKWTKGKGVIGQCWDQRTPQVHNALQWFRSHQNKTPAEWEQLPPEQRLGLSHREFQEIGPKYGTVIAVPMYRDDAVVGVITLDAPSGCHRKLLSRQQEIIGALATSARVIQDVCG